MLDSKSSQFTFSPDGKIFWQEKLNSPLSGIEVANIVKGKSLLRPDIELIECEQTLKHDEKSLKNCLSLWLSTHISEILEPLVLLETPSGAAVKDDPVSQISSKLYDNMGVLMRIEIEDLIAQLTPDMRTDLRAKQIRLGPLFAFIPALNKPAAVRLKAMLWAIFNGVDLPVNIPADGVVSVKIDDENPDISYYRTIGYPLYGGRAIRIDMLDRVINCIYDNANLGKFQARHEMAEWLGCSIEDLYKILEALGHKKIYDPADKVETSTMDNSSDSKNNENEDVFADNKPKDIEAGSDIEERQNIKPELATFRLKKGKISQINDISKKTYKKRNSDNKNDNSTNKKSGYDRKKHNKIKGKKGKNSSSSVRVISAEAKVSEDDSPFAILQQLKK